MTACQRPVSQVSSATNAPKVLWDSVNELSKLDTSQVMIKDLWPAYFSFRERSAYLSKAPSYEEFNLLLDELIEKQSVAMTELPNWAQQPSIRARMKVVYTYLNQTKSLFGLNQPVHSELNALFMGIKDMDQTLVLLRNQNNDSLLFVQDTLSQIPLQD
jgi:hypothetical protein